MTERCEYPAGVTCKPSEPEEFPPPTTTTTAPPTSSHPVTGGDVVGVAGIGLAFALIGAVLIQRGRTRA